MIAGAVQTVQANVCRSLRKRWREVRRTRWVDTALAVGLLALTGVALVAGAVVLIGAMIAFVTLLPAVLIWLTWNFVAPHINVPVQYQDIGFLTIWGLTVFLMVLRSVLLGKRSK